MNQFDEYEGEWTDETPDRTDVTLMSVTVGDLIMSMSDQEIAELFRRFMNSVVAQVTREDRFETR